MDKWDTEGQDAFNGYTNKYMDGSSSEESNSKKNGGCSNQRCKRIFVSNLFLLFLFCGIITGIGLGLGIRFNYPEFRENKRNLMYLEFPGKLLVRVLKMCIIPLVFASLVAGMASLPGKAARRLGLYAILYYMITTFMAVLLGILLVATIKPGLRAGQTETAGGSMVQPVDALLDLVRNIFPSNIMSASMQQARTVYKFKDEIREVTTVNATLNLTYKENVTEEVIESFSVKTVGGTNILGIVLFSIMLGLIIGNMGAKGAILYAVFDSFQIAIIKIIRIFIWYTPIGVCFLLASKLLSMENLEAEFTSLGWYIMTVLVGLAIHGFFILPLIYFLFTRRNPFKLLFHMTKALLTALGTASSAATMPVTLTCLEQNAQVDPRVSRFMIPVGATINMDGTALYEAVASIYLAQTLGYPLDAGQYVTVSLTATAAAIGAAGVPEAGLVTMLIVLTAIGLPATDDTLALIYAVDWFLDRCRTMINVWGDSIGAGIVERLSAKQLAKLDPSGTGGHANHAYVYDDNKGGKDHTRL